VNRYILVGLTAVVSAAAGAAAGYYISRKQLEKSYDERLAEEISSTRAHLNQLAKQGMMLRVPGAQLDPQAVAETAEEREANVAVGPGVLRKAVAELRYGPDAPISPAKPTLIQRNVFRDEEEPDEDEEIAWAQEIKERSSKKPYIIGVEEFGEDPKYHTVCLTYFMMDDTLLDDGEVPIDDPEMVVGESNLDRFGYRSKDPRLIYIRNEKLGADYEVTLHDGAFGDVIHGIATSQEKVRRTKFRPE